MPNAPIIVSAATVVPGVVLEVDGWPTRKHQLSTDIGTEPVESGGTVTDHAVPQPRTLVLDGVVHDLGGAQRPRAAAAALERLWSSAEPVSITTEWGSYDSMLIERLDIRTVGRGMGCRMTCREVIIVAAPVEVPELSLAAREGRAEARSLADRQKEQSDMRCTAVASAGVSIATFRGFFASRFRGTNSARVAAAQTVRAAEAACRSTATTRSGLQGPRTSRTRPNSQVQAARTQAAAMQQRLRQAQIGSRPQAGPASGRANYAGYTNPAFARFGADAADLNRQAVNNVLAGQRQNAAVRRYLEGVAAGRASSGTGRTARGVPAAAATRALLDRGGGSETPRGRVPLGTPLPGRGIVVPPRARRPR